MQVFAEIILGKASEIFTPEELKMWTIEKGHCPDLYQGIDGQVCGL